MIRVGLIGCGKWGPNHARNVDSLDGARLAAVVAEALDERSKMQESAAERPHTVAAARARHREELRHQLRSLLVECHGNIERMAARMGKSRSTVTYHLRRSGLR